MAVGGSPVGAGDLHEPRGALEVHVHAGPVAARPAVSVARHACEYQPGIVPRERFVSQAQAVHHPCAEVLHHHVRDGRQPLGDIPARRVLQVDGHRALVAVGVEIGGVAPVRVPVGRRPREVRMPAALHPHHVRAQVRQQPGAERRRQHVPKVEDTDSVQGGRTVFHCLPISSMLQATMPQQGAVSSQLSARPDRAKVDRHQPEPYIIATESPGVA